MKHDYTKYFKNLAAKQNPCTVEGQCDAYALKCLINRYLYLVKQLEEMDPLDLFNQNERDVVTGQVIELTNTLHLFGIEV